MSVPPAPPGSSDDQVHERLRESERRFRETLENAELAAVMLDAAGRVAFCNDYLLRLLGHRREEVLGQDWFDRFVPADLPGRKAAFQQEIAQGAVARHFETPLRTRDGTRRLIAWSNTMLRDLDGRVIGASSLGEDITERKLAEERLRQSEERYRQIFENDLTGDFVTTPDGRLLACNPAFARIFGFDSVDEALRAPLAALYPDPRVREALVQSLREHKSLAYQESELRRRDGRPVHVVENLVGTFDAAGDLILLNGYLFDNTERKKLEEQLRQAQKMEAVGRLAGGVAHDFNNLLTVITGYSELLLGNLPPDDPARDSAREIRKAGERAAALTRQLLAFSRKQVLAPVVLDLNALVRDLEKLLARLIGEDIDLVMALDPDLGRVRADPGQIEQVLMNLVVNARDAMPQGGRLTLETRNAQLDEAYARAHADVPPGPYALLSVSDTGCGMDEYTQAHLFEPFFTTKELGKGTGLGLATVYGIVKQSGGHLDVASAVGRGSRFQVYLPRLHEPATAHGPHPGLAGVPGGTETILLVEDEAGVRALTRHVLQTVGYALLEAEDGLEALRLARQHPGTIHLLLTDVVMPQMSGRQLADRLLPLRPGLRVLYLSGYTDDAVVRHGVEADRVAFLQKPFTPAVLGRKVREILDQTPSGRL